MVGGDLPTAARAWPGGGAGHDDHDRDTPASFDRPTSVADRVGKGAE